MRKIIFLLCILCITANAISQSTVLTNKDTVNLSYRLDTMSNYLLADNFYGRLTGLVVSYSGSGLMFNVTAGYFRLRDGALRFSPGGSVTLSAADATNPRWDVIGVDTTGAIFKKTGSAAASPSIPQVDDPESQLELTSVEILANEVIPSTIVQNIIYDENSGDAFTGTNTGVTVNYNNTSNVQHGSKSADVSSWTNGQTITFTKNTGTLNASDFTVLPFFIKLKSTLANNANIRISFLNGTTVVSNVLTLAASQGFSKGTTNYQNIAVSISSFTFTSTTFNKVRITLAGTGGGFYLDYMQLQSGLTVSNPETDAISLSKSISMINGYGISIPQSTTQTLNTNPTFTPSIDTFAISTRAWRQKLADSLGTVIHSTALDTVNVSNADAWAVPHDGVTSANANGNLMLADKTKRRKYFPAGVYFLDVSALRSGSQTNKKGLEVTQDSIEIFGDPAGGTIFKAKATASGDTSNTNFYALINALYRSNIYIHDITVDGNKANQSVYNSNPYVNPSGHNDTSKHYNINGIFFKDGYGGNKVVNTKVYNCPGYGIEAYNAGLDITNSVDSANGMAGIGYTEKAWGNCYNVRCIYNNSDNIRIDNCNTLYGIHLDLVEVAYSGTNASAPNWFAGLWHNNSSNLYFNRIWAHDNSAYGLDGGAPHTVNDDNINFSNILDEYNGNGGYVTSNKGVKLNNILFKNNGKKRDGTTDTHSNYNPGAIVVNNLSNLLASNLTIIDTGVGSQTYAFKNWGGGGSTGFNNANISNVFAVGIADTAHFKNGDNGTNNFDNIKIFNLSGTAIPLAADTAIYAYVNSTKILIPKWANTGSATTPAGSNTQVQFNSAGAFGSSANFTYSSPLLTLLNNGIANTTTSSLYLSNTTAPTSGVTVQRSPAIQLGGGAWQTTTPIAQTSDWFIENVPVSQTTNIQSNLTFSYSHNGGAKTAYMTLQSGNVTNALLTITHANISTNLQTPAINGLTSQNLLINGAARFSTLNGNLQLGSPSNTPADAGYKLAVEQEAQINGGVYIKKYTSPATPATQIIGTPGSTTITYKIVPRMQNGTTGDPISVSVSTANATLTTSNWVNLTNANLAVTPAYAWDVYRVSTNGTSPTSLGKIQSVLSGGTNWASVLFDKGAAGDGTTAPTTNTTADLSIGTQTATANLTVNGSVAYSYINTAVDYTVLWTDHTIEITATGKTATLPTAVGIAGKVYTIKLTASGSGTVATTSSQTIDGSTTYSLSAQYKYVTVQSNGSNWLIIANN